MVLIHVGFIWVRAVDQCMMGDHHALKKVLFYSGLFCCVRNQLFIAARRDFPHHANARRVVFVFDTLTGGMLLNF